MIATALSLAKEAEDLTSTGRAHTNKRMNVVVVNPQ